FVTALRYLENRIKLFMALPFDQLDVMALRAHVREIGQGEGASNRRGDAA
ncbi:ArsR family transcriptional regulator, partial [Rhizorhabdus dicambivorans]